MDIELTPPAAHDARHDVDLVIQGLPSGAFFCCQGFVALSLSDADVRRLREELDEWLATRP